MKELIFCLAALAFFVSCEPAVSSDNFARLTGQVLDSQTGEPIGKAYVYLVPDTENGINTGNDGYFDFQRLEPGKYTIWAQKKGYVSNHKEVTTKAGEMTDTRLMLDKKEE